MAITKFLDPKNDVAFRRIFGSEKNKDILIHFINDVLELKEGDKIDVTVKLKGNKTYYYTVKIFDYTP